MTYEEAIKELEQIPKHIGGDCDGYEKRAIRIAIEALEKQIPKKPYDINREMKSFDCPYCLSSLYAEDELENVGYCCVCGQALDWSK